MRNEDKVLILKQRIKEQEYKGVVNSGVIRKWKREIRNLTK